MTLVKILREGYLLQDSQSRHNCSIYGGKDGLIEYIHQQEGHAWLNISKVTLKASVARGHRESLLEPDLPALNIWARGGSQGRGDCTLMTVACCVPSTGLCM